MFIILIIMDMMQCLSTGWNWRGWLQWVDWLQQNLWYLENGNDLVTIATSNNTVQAFFMWYKTVVVVTATHTLHRLSLPCHSKWRHSIRTSVHYSVLRLVLHKVYTVRTFRSHQQWTASLENLECFRVLCWNLTTRQPTPWDSHIHAYHLKA